MGKLRVVLALMLALIVAGCGSSKFRTYDGPEVTQLQLYKGSRDLYLLHNGKVLKRYKVDLGFAPVGHKQVEGDGRTPEGYYVIDRRNPNSSFHLSIGLDYPRPHDVEAARALGMSPGGDIFIHGKPKRFSGASDWTAGCIAVTNDEMEEIYSMVRDGTPIWVNP